MTITDIGETRPGMFIKDRSKAALNLESLKLINGVPSHIWDPLVMSKIVKQGESAKQFY
jgi:hypothetical protein